MAYPRIARSNAKPTNQMAILSSRNRICGSIRYFGDTSTRHTLRMQSSRAIRDCLRGARVRLRVGLSVVVVFERNVVFQNFVGYNFGFFVPGAFDAADDSRLERLPFFE